MAPCILQAAYNMNFHSPATSHSAIYIILTLSSIPQLLLFLIDESCTPAELFGLEEYLKGKTNE